MQNSTYTKPLNLELWRKWLASYFYHKKLKKRFEATEKTWSLRETGLSHEQKFLTKYFEIL